MLSKIVLCITSKQATVGIWRWGRLTFCTAFSGDQAGQDEFRQLLQQHANVPIHMIADVVEEDYRLETMPHTAGHSRREMVERKLGQLYRNTNYRAAQFIERDREGKRHDDRFLLMAMTNTALVAPWLSIIEDMQAPLAGIYLLPVVSQLLVKALKIQSANLLLMTRQSAGLRQSYFSGEHLKVSRLTPLAGMDKNQIDKLYFSETEKTRLYLVSLHIMDRESRLHLVYPVTDQQDTTLATQLANRRDIDCDVIAADTLAYRFGLDASLLQRYPDLLHMHMLARHKPADNLAPGNLLRRYRLHTMCNAINLASAICISVAVALSTINLLNAAEMAHRLRDAAAQTSQQNQRYAEVARDFPQTPQPGRKLQTAVELAQKIDKLNRTPQRLMGIVSSALDAQREIQLNRLHWKLSEDANAADEEGKTSPASGNVPASPTGLYEIGFINGEIENFSGDYRAALDNVNMLAERLKQHPQVEQVTILQQPVNTDSLATLQGSTLDPHMQHLPTASFRIRVILKPETRP